MATHLLSNVNMNMWNKTNIGPFLTPTFAGAEFHGSEENLLFPLICIGRRM